MKVVEFKTQENVRSKIQQCSDYNHIQQVAYSTYHDALTQTCFDCGAVRTNLEDANKKTGDKQC